MNWLILLPALFLALLLLFSLGGQKHSRGLFKETFLQLLLLFFLTAAIALFSSQLLKKIFYFPRLLFILWLLVWFFLLVFAVKTLAYFIFDFLLLKKQGIRYPKLVKDVLVFILFIVGILLILNYYLNIKITVLLASSAVFTVVIGFALQDILNFEDSFKLSDWVRINEWEGRVEQFGWRSFKVRTIDRELIVIPNQTASKAEVMIYGPGHQPVALKIMVGASYHDSPDRVSEAIDQVLTSLPDICRDPLPVVQLKKFGDFSLDYEVKFWILDYAQHNVITAEVRRRIWYAFKRQNIQIPFPVRELYQRPDDRNRTEISRQVLVDALKGNEILRTIAEKEFKKLLDEVECKIFGAGETIIREGADNEFFSHVYSGAVNVLKDGRVLARLQAGDFFGEISLVTGEKTGATVVADRESIIIIVSSARFRQIIGMNKDLAMKLSSVITRRQEELKLFSEKSQAVGAGAGKKISENLFKRILNYFALKK
jgi:small-conductance mechanosensitive channel